MASKLNIIIVNWEREEDTLECLHSIKKQLINYQDYNVFLVDNGSKEGIDKIKAIFFPFNLFIIENSENKGFTGGNNTGLEMAMNYNSLYTLLLNNDTVLVDNSIQEAISFLDQNKNFGIVGLINYYFHNNKIWQAGFKLNLNTGKQKQVLPSLTSMNQYSEVDYVPGSSLIIRTNLIDKIGLLDDNYFAYWEEVDWCMKVRQLGYKIGFLNSSKVLHKVKQTTSSKVHFYLSNRNKLYFNKKNAPKKTFQIIFVKVIFRFLIKKIFMKESNSFRTFGLLVKDFLTGNMGKGSLDNLR